MGGPAMAPAVSRAGAGALRVIVVDDQAAVREGLVTLLDLLPDVQVAGSAASGEDAVALVAELTPDVVLMDIRMPGMSGIEATRHIRAHHPSTSVVVLTTYADDSSVREAMQAGAIGYLTKDTGRDGIARALHSAAEGHTVLDPAARDYLLSAARGARRSPGGAQAVSAPQTDPVPGGPPPGGLTPREAEVLALMASGLPNSAIARRLYVSESTIKTHVNHVFTKIGVSDRAQAVSFAYRHGMVTGTSE